MTVAIFDLDFTILEGDCEWMWGEFLTEKGIVKSEFLSQMSRYFQEYDSGELDIWEYQRFFLEPLVNIDSDLLQCLKQEFILRIRVVLRSAVLDRINWHRLQGHTTLLLSAANNILAEPIARMLNFPYYICTRVEMNQNNPTGEIIGIPAFREGKFQNLEIWLKQNSVSLDESWGYSDSSNDISLLKRVEYPVAVTPDLNLRKHALLKGWRVMDL